MQSVSRSQDPIQIRSHEISVLLVAGGINKINNRDVRTAQSISPKYSDRASHAAWFCQEPCRILVLNVYPARRIPDKIQSYECHLRTDTNIAPHESTNTLCISQCIVVIARISNFCQPRESCYHETFSAKVVHVCKQPIRTQRRI